jgi:hypothetical protein
MKFPEFAWAICEHYMTDYIRGRRELLRQQMTSIQVRKATTAN